MIVLGTYGGSVVGWRRVIGEPRVLIMSFAYDSHARGVKTVSIDHFKQAMMLSGGVDEQVR